MEIKIGGTPLLHFTIKEKNASGTLISVDLTGYNEIIGHFLMPVSKEIVEKQIVVDDEENGECLYQVLTTDFTQKGELKLYLNIDWGSEHYSLSNTYTMNIIGVHG